VAGAGRAVDWKARMTATNKDFIVQVALRFGMDVVGNLKSVRPRVRDLEGEVT
jgi:hypothetical protein